jgi:hypothetical protein
MLVCLPLLFFGCGRGQDILTATFPDDLNGEPGSGLVGAPARSVDMIVVTGADCDTVQSKKHDDAMPAGTIIAHHSARFPVNPKAGLLDRLPRGTPLVLDIAALDAESHVIARDCVPVTLNPSAQTNVTALLRSLPQCTMPPSSLDIAVVLDDSDQMTFVDPSNYHMDYLSTVLITGVKLSTPVLWTIIAHNTKDGVTQTLPATTDITAAQSAVDALRVSHKGSPALYDGVTYATAALRERAVCGYRPAMFMVSADIDGGSMHAEQDAVIGIVAVASDTTDDIFTYGLALSSAAYDALNAIIPMSGEVYGADGTSDFQIRGRFADAAIELKKLVSQ